MSIYFDLPMDDLIYSIESAEKSLILSLENQLSELSVLQGSLEIFGRHIGIKKKGVFEINIVLDEIITNIISYGYNDKRKHVINVKITFYKQSSLIIYVEDDGVPFNLIESKDPDLESPIEKRDVGGMGIYIIKHYINDIAYIRKENKNIIKIKKNMGKKELVNKKKGEYEVL